MGYKGIMVLRRSLQLKVGKLLEGQGEEILQVLFAERKWELLLQ